MIKQISALLEESHLIAYATEIKQTVIPERKLENVLQNPAMKPSLKRLHAACQPSRRMGKWLQATSDQRGHVSAQEAHLCTSRPYTNGFANLLQA
jgi:hypothetical protein